MATTAGPILRFDIEADAEGFTAALKDAQNAVEASATSFRKQFEEASERALVAIETFAQKAIDLATEVGVVVAKGSTAFVGAWTDGADGAEQAITGFVTGAKEKTEDWMRGLIAGIPGKKGKLAAAVYDLFSGAIDSAIDKTVSKGAGFLDTLLGKAQDADLTDKLRDKVVDATGKAFAFSGATDAAMATSREKVSAWADSIKGTLDDLVEGARSAMQKFAGTFEGITDAGQKAIDAIKARIENERLLYSTLDLSAGQAARLRAETEALARAGKTWAQLTSEETQALTEQLTELERVTGAREALQKSLADQREYERFLQSINSSLERQILLNRSNADAINKTAGERAKERAEAQIRGFGRKGEGERALQDPNVQASLARVGDEAQIAASIKLNNDLAEALRQQSAAYELQIKSLAQSAGETERLKFLQMELNQAYRAGVPVTAEMRASFEAAAAAIAQTAQQAADAQQRMKDLQAVGQSVSRSLEDAFVSWTTKGKFSAKEFLNSLAADIERLALRALILQPLFGGGSTPGAGLFGKLFSGLGFGGFKAGGGDVFPSSAYVVGEKGPELFVPRSAGTIVPNGGGSVGPTTIQMRVDLTGANGDETIRRISAQAARQAAVAAIQQSNAAFPARQRQLQMLGT